MLLCQIEMRSLDQADNTPDYYIVGRYGFEPSLNEREEVWINWQIADNSFEIRAQVTGRRKEVYVDGRRVAMNMSDAEKDKFLALYPNGIQALLEGASLFLVRIFVEATDRDALLKIREAIAKGDKVLGDIKRLPDSLL